MFNNSSSLLQYLHTLVRRALHTGSAMTVQGMPLSKMDFLQICWRTWRASVFDFGGWSFRDIKMKYFFHKFLA